MAKPARGNEIRRREKKLLKLSQYDQNLVHKFIRSRGTLSKARIKKLEDYCGKIGYELKERCGKSLKEVSRADLVEYLNEVNDDDYAEDTKRDIRIISKGFFRKLRGAKFVDGIKIGTVEGSITSEDILTDEEKDRLRAAAASDPRNAALVEFFIEVGPRTGEGLNVLKTDIELTKEGGLVTLVRRGQGTGKTKSRTIPIINAAPPLSNWLAHHPLKERDAGVWVDNTHSKSHHPLRASGLRIVFRRLGKKAKIDKRVYPYIFRHTRATELARRRFSEPMLCEFFGWRLGSPMPRRYVHLAMRDLQPAIMEIYGLKKEGLEPLRSPKVCVRCGLTNAAHAELCSRCGMALTVEAAKAAADRAEGERKEFKEMKETVAKLAAVVSKRLGTETPNADSTETPSHDGDSVVE